MKIYKYAIQPGDAPSLTLPIGAKFLDVQVQSGRDVQSWWLVDPQTEETERRQFRVYGTGDDVLDTDKLVYLATFQLLGGSLVFHLFEERSP